MISFILKRVYGTPERNRTVASKLRDSAVSVATLAWSALSMFASAAALKTPASAPTLTTPCSSSRFSEAETEVNQASTKNKLEAALVNLFASQGGEMEVVHKQFALELVQQFVSEQVAMLVLAEVETATTQFSEVVVRHLLPSGILETVANGFLEAMRKPMTITECLNFSVVGAVEAKVATDAPPSVTEFIGVLPEDFADEELSAQDLENMHEVSVAKQ